MTANKLEAKATKTDADEIAWLEANDMMILPQHQRAVFFPDDDPNRADGMGRRPVTFLAGADQSTRTVKVMLPPGIRRHQEIYEHPLCTYRLQTTNPNFKLKVLDEVMYIRTDFSWVHESLVTGVSDNRVTQKPRGTEIELTWPAKPDTAAARAA